MTLDHSTAIRHLRKFICDRPHLAPRDFRSTKAWNAARRRVARALPVALAELETFEALPWCPEIFHAACALVLHGRLSIRLAGERWGLAYTSAGMTYRGLTYRQDATRLLRAYNAAVTAFLPHVETTDDAQAAL